MKVNEWVFILVLASSGVSEAGASTQATKEKRLLWGDTHLHTGLSLDAYLNKNFSTTPDTAYRFAKGEPVKHPYSGQMVQLKRPLDFLVVSDHAENLGMAGALVHGSVPTEGLSLLDRAKIWFMGLYFEYLAKGDRGLDALAESSKPESDDVVASAGVGKGPDFPNAGLVDAAAWRETITAADEHYLPGEFTSFIGWEWTSIPAAANLHRVVFTSSDSSVAKSIKPFSAYDSEYPEDLWQFLDKTAQQFNADFIAIPHNSNVSRGFMFPQEKTLRDKPIDAKWIHQRSHWENVVEITQIKGDSETHPLLSPEDEFADFEPYSHTLIEVDEPYRPRSEDFARPALKTGLVMARKGRGNPYKFGFVGSSDSHTGFSNVEEADFWGKYAKDWELEGRQKTSLAVERFGWEVSASGLAAVWAESNTREDLFAAFKRREVYATTGPRISVRIFGGTDYAVGDEHLPMTELASRGVPMGGELSGLSGSPSFVIRAGKDPEGAGLDRIQIVKGWFDGEAAHERVYDIAWSDDREPGISGKLLRLADPVVSESGSFSTQQGVPVLATVWIDPDFDPGQAAFYYARVLETPTPRHSTYDAIKLGIHPDQTGKPEFIQERAYTSPIFYSP